MVIILFLFMLTVSSKVCIKTFEERRSNIAQIEIKINKLLDNYPNIRIINMATYRSDDDYSWHHGGYVSYYCESINHTIML